MHMDCGQEEQMSILPSPVGATEHDASGARRRFFPALQYLSTSKIAIAVAGNFAFAVALCVYQATVKVSAHVRPGAHLGVNCCHA